MNEEDGLQTALELIVLAVVFGLILLTAMVAVIISGVIR